MTIAAAQRHWTIRECRERSDLDRLFHFRYVEYVAKKGLFQESADHLNQSLSDTVDTFATNILAEADGMVVGSIRLNRFDQFVQRFILTEYRIMDLGPEVFDRGCVGTRAIVHPDWRRTPVFSDLALTVARRMRDDGLRWMFVDTSPPRAAGEEPKFISLYSALGFKIWRENAEVPGIGMGAVMLLDLEETMTNPQSLARLYLN